MSLRDRAVNAFALMACTLLVLVCSAPPAGAAPPPRLRVSAAALLEPETGQTLYARNAGARLPIASTTKLMTALITLEHVHRLGRIFTQNNFYAAPADSQIALVPGERMSVHDLMLALLLPSADDAAEDLAYNVGHGSVARFIGMMNARARQLGLTHTHYATPSGLDTPGNYSSASDLLKLASYVRAHSRFFTRTVATPRAVLHTGSHVRVVVNRNDLVGRVRWVNGIKTGHTLGAGYVLVGSATRHGLTLLSAVLGTASESARDANTLALLGYGFANFRRVSPVQAGEVLARPTVKDRPGVRVDVFAATSVTHVIARSAPVRIRLTVPKQLRGPLKRHAQVGEAVVLAGGRVIARVPVLLSRALAAVSPVSIAARFLTRPSTLLVIAALIGSGLTLAGLWRRRARQRAAARPEVA